MEDMLDIKLIWIVQLSTHVCHGKHFNHTILCNNPFGHALEVAQLHNEIIKTFIHSLKRFIRIEIFHVNVVRTINRKINLTTLNEDVVRERRNNTLWDYILCIDKRNKDNKFSKIRCKLYQANPI